MSDGRNRGRSSSGRLGCFDDRRRVGARPVEVHVRATGRVLSVTGNVRTVANTPIRLVGTRPLDAAAHLAGSALCGADRFIFHATTPDPMESGARCCIGAGVFRAHCRQIDISTTVPSTQCTAIKRPMRNMNESHRKHRRRAISLIGRPGDQFLRLECVSVCAILMESCTFLASPST